MSKSSKVGFFVFLLISSARLLSAAALAGMLPAQAVHAAAERRIALVIGNGAYKSAPLKNPVGDAEAVAVSLRQLRYEVTLRQNTSLVELIEALREFSVRAATSTTFALVP